MNKKLMIFTLACFCSLFSLSHGSDSSRILTYIQNVMNFNNAVPQEKVYLHLDNTGYFENETMWFKAYVTRTDRQSPSDLSKVLYVELLNPSGDVLKTTKWPIDSLGTANGDMKLDTLFGSGFYEVRAYTRYMTNWGVNACFSRVIPVFKAPKKEGDYRDLTIARRLYRHRDPNNRASEDSLYQKAIDEGISTNGLMKTVSVHFYPEGGDLVLGLRSRVALLAVDDNGRAYQGEGAVVNESGDTVTTVKTDSLGRGLFDLVPDGSPLTLQMRNLKRKIQTFALPGARSEGCALTLDAVSESLSAKIECTSLVVGRTIGFAVMNNGNITYCDTVSAAPLIEISLDRSKQRPGVNQLTVFDGMGRILAERMFFICPQPSKSDSIHVSSATQRLKPCGRVELELSSLPNTSISLSAMDAATMTNGREGNMKTWMLLSSDIKGYISNVGYYFESDDSAHRRSADLLMLTQGWRRYDWELMSGMKTFSNAQPIEDRFYVYGRLNVYRKRNPVGNVRMQAFLFNDKGQSLSGETVTDESGNYAFSLPFVDGEWRMQIFTRREDRRKTFYVGIDRQFSPQARYISPSEAEITHPLAANIFTRREGEPVDTLADEFIPITERNHVLKNVNVKAKRRYFTNDDWHYKNESFGRQFATLYYDIDRGLNDILDRGEPEPTIFEYLCRVNKMFGNPECKDLPNFISGFSGSLDDPDIDIIRPSLPPSSSDGRMSYGGRPIKWFVDNGDTNVEITITSKNIGAIEAILGCHTTAVEMLNGEKWGLLTSEVGTYGDVHFPFFMSEIKHLYICPYSPKEEDGAVRIYLYTHKRFTTESQKGLRRTYFQGFNKPETFKMEDYSIIPAMADFRRTIYWDPNVRTDSKGKAKVTFYNNSTTQDMYISAEGMSEDGRIVINE